jgi:nitroreductase
MDVYEAVASRRAVRSFTDEDVPRRVLDRVLSAAARSPSSDATRHARTGRAPLGETVTFIG